MYNKNDLEDRKSNLSAAKRALLESRIKGKLAADKLPKQQGIPRRQEANHVPLSFAQQRLWFLYQLEPDSPYYNIPTAVRLKGDVRQDLLERAINEIVRRHEALRTTFASRNEQPVQVIAEDLFVPLEWIDLQDAPDLEKAAEQLAFQEASKAFNIEQGPLIRTLIAQLTPQDYLLFLNVHHIVTDGWSSNVMVTEIAAVYDAFLSGKPNPLPPMPIQYADFAVWQRNYLQGDVLEKQLAYWKQQLGGSLPVLQLPTDRPRPAVQTFNGDSLVFRVEKALTDRLKVLATEQNASMFMVLLAAFKTLLYRYTGQEDLLVGTPIAGRNRGEVEGLIGFFANTLVLRTSMRDEMTFRELVAQVRQVALDAYAHQDFPFEKLVEELQPERDMSTSAMFQVMFIHQKNQWIKFERETLTIEPMEVTSKTAKFDLSLFTLEWPEVVEGAFEYNTDLFDAATIARMKEQMLSILRHIAEHPDAQLADIPLLSQAEREQLLVDWNQTDVAYPTNLCVHQLFEQQVERTPDAVAVTYQGQSLRYHELNARANQLASRLRALGVRPDVAVGICMERSLEMVVGVVAILKAGGSYVSLDPNYPEDRLAFMLADTQVPVLLTHSTLADRFATGDATVLCLDQEEKAVALETDSNLQNLSTPKNLAYILYTSGSTGKPKGVMMTHDVVVNLLHWQLDNTVLRDGARTMQFASLNFDVSFQEIFTTLCSGGNLLLVEEDVRRDPVRLLRFLDEEAVERIFLPFVAFQQLAEVASTAETVPQALREIITAGEQLQVSRQIVKWLSQTPGVVVHNQYGPSESHVVTALTLSGSPKKWPALPAIGHPIANAQLYLLDRRLQPVPIGVPGELYIGGPVLARGYLNREDLTQERFLPNPFVNEPGALMYKTGDMARYVPDGTIEFLGRADDQVKIRGYRIELGEIENVLTQHPSVSEAAVIAREDVPGDKRLAAYLVVDKAYLPDSMQLRKFLLARLPEYMVPSAFVYLEALPLTPSGKLDRRALPAPERDREELQRTYVAPRTPVEEVLATIWAEVLRVEQVGVVDNFFELGGHSLLATQVVSRIKAAFDVELPLRKLFEAPTVADLALAVEQASHMTPAPPIVPVSRDQVLPLSFAQERLWFFEQLQPGTATYNLPNIVRLDGRLNVDALERTCNEIIARHESVRTGFALIDGQPVQVIRDELQLTLQKIDLTHLPDREREAEAKRLATEEAMRPFDIMKEDLVRGMLLCLDETEHVLILNMHHICSDGWSMGVMVQELAAIYGAFVNDRPSPLRPLPIQYADFSVWQRNWLSGDVLDEQMSYWKEKLGGEIPLLQLPTDHPRPAVRSFRGGDQMFSLPASLTKQLHQLAQREGVTMYMLLLAAFNVLMHRYSGQDDILVGSPIANRNRGEIEGLIGFFVNTLVMRSDLSGTPSFQEVLKRVRKTTIDAYAHQDLPFEKLVEELQPDRNMSTSALFQVLFVLQNAPQGSLDLPGLSISPWNITSGTSKFDLSIYMVEEEGILAGGLEYNADLFEHDTMLRVIEHFKQLLTSIVAEPARAIGELPMLTEAERHRVLVEWNDTTTAYSRMAAIHQVFEEQVASDPDSIALVAGDMQLTYRELNERANRLAHHLQKRGVGPDTLVGICAERSMEMVVGLLGILKAGGAYVPLDPNYPQERLAHMLADAGVSVLVAHEHLLSQLPSSEADVVLLDAEGTAFAEECADNVDVAVTGENVAYVMYTSGSTGTPKGVVIPQRGVVRLVKETGYAEFGACHVFLQFAPISFDAATFEIWGALLNGAKLVLAPTGKLSLEELGDVLISQKVTTLWLTAGLFHQMVEGHLPALQHVRQLLAGGDVLSPSHVKKVLEHVPGCVVINGYGPTESTTFATCYAMNDVAQVGATVSIGEPIANTQVYVLDAHKQPVPIGVPGELFIAGDGLARGYLNQPELTAERFVPNPFAADADADADARMYQTGDLVRYLHDGTLEFLGRIDGQVKIRGFRIEPGDIEAALEAHPYVREAVVMAREDVPGDKRLVAYAVLQEADAVTVSALRHFVKDKLPDHLLPSAIVLLDEFPLTPNGKVDRRALPAPDASRQVDSEYVAPRTETEQVLAAIWQEVLGVAQVGVTDHFFEMGGHSLLATQLLSRMRNAFQVELPLRALFDTPTIEGIAVQLDRASKAGYHMQVVRTETTGEGGREFPLSFAQQRLWFLDQFGPGNAAYNIPFAFRLMGPLDIDLFASYLQMVVDRHESLRTTFAEVEGQPVQRVAPQLELHMPVIDLRGLTDGQIEQEIKRLSERDARQPFDLQTGPLMRVSLVQVSATEHVLLMNMHHIISDGWSMGIIVREVSEQYKARLQGRSAPLPELALQYGDFALWQRNYLQGVVLDEQLAYWKQQFAEPVTALQLPTDRQRPPVQTFNGAMTKIHIAPELTAKLNQLSQQEGTTLFMTLLAALNTLFYRYSGQEDIVIGSPIANRNRAEIEGLIGFFVNTLALRTDLSGNPTFRDLLARVRQTAMDAYSYQDLPFEMLVEALQVDRDMSRHPLFQVMLVLHNAPVNKFITDELTVAAIDVEHGTAKFDLTFSLSESEAGLTGELDYNIDLYDEATVKRMLGHLNHLLAQIVEEPNRELSAYSILPEAERHQLLVEWNAPISISKDVAFPLRTLHELFEMQAAKAPDAAAVTFEKETLTYAELNDRANRVAHHLQKRGVVAGQRIGLAVERSLDVIIGLLGILKTGAAYVPLDPTYPAERLAFMMEDSQMPFVLTQQKWLDVLPTSQVEMICLDRDWSEIAMEPSANLISTATTDSLAYVIYTSGSTGKPKGVLINHSNVVRLFAETEAWYGFNEQDVWTLFHSYAFDFSVWEIWGALLYGGRLVVVPYLTSREPAAFYRLLLEEKVTVLNQTPSAFRQLIRVDEEAAAQGESSQLALRYVIFGGEALELQSLQPWFDLHGDQTPQLVNMYGITETTVHVTYRPISQADLTADTGSVIGRPIPDLQVYVLDPYGQPVPIGVPGELYVGGRGVAQGYLNRPELTAERFIPHPFVENARLYRTGDLARYLANGDLEYLGRIDHQVKLRGFRIELGEIEAVLAGHPAIREAVVLVREDVPGDQRLVAYVVAKDELPDAAELRRYVESHLPEHMVPSAYVQLDQLPLTANGKVDRNALPAPLGVLTTERTETYVAPRDALERTLVSIWEELLGTRPVGIRENFFALGGHSLLAVRLMAQVKKQFGQDVPLALLFQGGTIEQLADLLRRQGLTQTNHSLVTIQAQGEQTPFFCVHPVGGSVFCYRELSHLLGDDQPFYGLQARGLEPGQEPLTVIQEMAANYIDEIRAVQAEGPYQLGGWSLGGIIAFEMAGQLRRAGQEVSSLVLFDSFAPDLIKQPGAVRESDLLRQFAYDMAGGQGVNGAEPEWLAHLDGMETEAALRLLFQQATSRGMMPNDEASYQQFCRLFRVFQANLQALQSYEPERYVQDVTLLRASERPMQAAQYPHFDEYNGWQLLVKGELTVQEVPGDHFTILQQPRVQTVATKLRETWTRHTTGLEVHE